MHQAKAAAAGKSVGVHGADTIQQLLNAGLLQMRRVWLGEQELKLTPKEFDLLDYLMCNRGIVLPRDQLLRDVWGGRVAARSQTLDVHIRWLRQKVERDPDQPIYIQTVRMIGYRFDGP